jgi:DNA-binding transcriptional LysR family regulator
MELHQIRYFVALSRLLNFTRAAEQCHITQPALTKAIQRLEIELGGELIYRERQFTKLTELGKIVLPRLEEMLSAADAARRSADDFRKRKEPPLKIGLATNVSAALLGAIAPKIVALHPTLQIDVVEAPTAELLTLLHEGDITAALSGDLADMPERLYGWRLFEEGTVVQVSPLHPLARMQSIPPAALHEQIWIHQPDCKITARFWAKHFADLNPPKVAHRARHTSNLQEIVAAGLGIMLAPEHMPCPQSVVARTIQGDSLSRVVQLLTVSGRRRSAPLESFIRTARDYDWCEHVRVIATSNVGNAITIEETPKANRTQRAAENSPV